MPRNGRESSARGVARGAPPDLEMRRESAMRRRVVIIAGFTLIVAAVATGQTALKWVDRIKVDVRAGKASFHEIVDTLLKGEQVTVLKTEDKWLNVRTPRGKNGWLFEQALSAKVVEPGG